jgi:DNA repair protein RecN (Recombination protein N)
VLRELHVRNLAVLASASVQWRGGLNVLTGETGAGKSIVVDSLTLLAGARADSDRIRTGADTLGVTGVFEPAGEGWRRVLEEAGLDGEGPELLIRREISRNGRNRVYLNDQPTTLRLLQDLAPHLLRIHGQRDELELISPELQRHWVDRCGGSEGARLRAGTAEAHAAYERLAARLDARTGDQRLRAERLDLLRFQASEIDTAQLRAGEEEALRVERDQLRHREAIHRALGGSVALLYDDEDAAADRLARAGHLLEEIAEWQPEASGWCTELEELRIRTEEQADTLRRHLEDVEAEPGRLDEVEDRLAILERLRRKYQRSIDEILALRQEIGAELGELEDDSEDLETLQGKVEEALDSYRKVAVQLTAGRHKWGEALVAAVNGELASLGLARARLSLAVESRRREGSPLLLDGGPVDFSAEGVDQVTFLFAPNPGEEPQPLGRIASGGELSRVYLALQLAVRSGGLTQDGEGDGSAAEPTLVFDEVDTGIGGAEAEAVGRKLQALATGGQILAVTHLPQVASFGDRHFKVGKAVREGRTHATVDPLEKGDRVEEIARMLAGKEITSTSREHARELLDGARREAPAKSKGGSKARKGRGGQR